MAVLEGVREGDAVVLAGREVAGVASTLPDTLLLPVGLSVMDAEDVREGELVGDPLGLDVAVTELVKLFPAVLEGVRDIALVLLLLAALDALAVMLLLPIFVCVGDPSTEPEGVSVADAVAEAERLAETDLVVEASLEGVREIERERLLDSEREGETTELPLTLLLPEGVPVPDTAGVTEEELVGELVGLVVAETDEVALFTPVFVALRVTLLVLVLLGAVLPLPVTLPLTALVWVREGLTDAEAVRDADVVTEGLRE